MRYKMGWHPHCRCIATPIFKTDEELERDDELILQGKEPTDGSENEVTELPDNFTDWVERNQDRIDRAKSKPYFLSDNAGVINGSGSIATSLRANEETPKSGVVPDERGRFVEISKSEIIENLRELSQNYTHEEAYVVLEDGKVFHKRGDEGEVKFHINERKLFAGAEVYHNHPIETLSPNDILFGIHNNLKEIHAITQEMDYCVVFGTRIKIDKKTFWKLYNECGDEISEKMATMNSKEYMEHLKNFQHLNIAALCRRLGLSYTRKSIQIPK